MSAVIACAGRFHLFDQARQLHKHCLLRHLVTDLPASRALQWGIPRDKVMASPHRGFLNTFYMKMAMHLPFAIRSKFMQNMHRGFAASLPSRVPVDADILIVHSSFFLEALPWAREHGILTIVDHGSLHEQTERDVLMQECEAYGFARSGNWQYPWLIEREDVEFQCGDQLFVCSNLAKQTLANHGVAECKVFVNQLGVDLSAFSPGKKHDDVFRVIYSSGVNPRKGIHYLLKAFHELSLPNSELWIVGGMTNDPELKKHVSPYFDKKNIIYKGSLSQHELVNIYTQGSVFILPSLADGWGMVVLQAMACELPVIVTDMTGAKEAVSDGVNGFVIPSRSVDAIKEKLLWLYDHPEAINEMGRNAGKAVRWGYSWDDYGNRLADFLTGFHAG